MLDVFIVYWLNDWRIHPKNSILIKRISFGIVKITTNTTKRKFIQNVRYALVDVYGFIVLVIDLLVAL